MCKKKINLRKVIAIAICFAGIIMFSGCDDQFTPKELSGTWVLDNGKFAITFIDGKSAIFTQINSGGWLTLFNRGIIDIGSKKIKDIKQTGDLTWTCKELYYTFYTDTGIPTGETLWKKNTITMNENGNTIFIEDKSVISIYFKLSE